MVSTYCTVCEKDLPLITSPRPRIVREPTALGTSFFVQVQRDGMDASSTLLATVIYGTRWSAVGPTCHSCFNFSFFSVVSSSPCSPTWLTQPLHRSSRLCWSPAFVPRHASRRHTPLRCAVRRCMPSRRSVYLLPRKKPAAAATS